MGQSEVPHTRSRCIPDSGFTVMMETPVKSSVGFQYFRSGVPLHTKPCLVSSVFASVAEPRSHSYSCFMTPFEEPSKGEASQLRQRQQWESPCHNSKTPHAAADLVSANSMRIVQRVVMSFGPVCRRSCSVKVGLKMRRRNWMLKR